MPANPAHIVRDEWIGKRISWDGRVGIVRDETMHTFKVEMENDTMKTIMKNAYTFGVETPQGRVEVVGKLLVKRPHDRLKQR